LAFRAAGRKDRGEQPGCGDLVMVVCLGLPLLPSPCY
jgi:hypothetical protein